MAYLKKTLQHWHNLEKKFIPPQAWESDLLTLWRERIIFILFFSMAVLSPFALIPSLILSFKEGLLSVFILDCVAYIVVLVVLLSKKFSLQQKTWVAFLIFYFLGIALLCILGFYGGGYIWLFGAALIVGSMIGVRAANIALFINFLSLVSIGVYIAVGLPEWASAIENAIQKWIVMTVNFMLINTLITLLVAAMLNSLKAALTREQETAIELREKREELLTILKASPDPILVYDGRDHVQYLNDAFTATFGWHLNDVEGEKIPFVPEGQQKISCDLFAKKTEVRFETTRYTKDGLLLNISLSAAPIKGNRDNTIGIVVNMKDITELKRLELNLKQAQKMESIGTLAGGIAHDFNNILSGIFGYSQLAQIHMENPEKARNHIEQIVKGAQRATELIRQILTFSRQGEYRKQPFKIYIEIKETLKLLRSSIPATIEIKQKLDSRKKVMADPIKIHQVIMNLCTNAYHAMRKTGGCLTVSLTDVDFSDTNFFKDKKIVPGKYIKLEVSDTGHGMDEETLNKAFDPYFSTKKKEDGTGLGLALVQAIIEEHDGFFEVYSQPANGTNFYLYFPIVLEEIKSNAPEVENKSHMAGKETIMVVDDEEAIRYAHKELLEDYGYKALIFDNGADALATFKSDPDKIDLIITDMTMPKLTGDKLATDILKIKPDMPIVLCTGFNENMSRTEAMALGIKKYIQKPIQNNEILILIRKILDK